MNRLAPIAAALALLAAGPPAHAQAVDQAAFHREVVTLYPADWGKRDPGKLDAFTTRIAEAPQTWLPLLRVEIARPDAPNAFLYDGAIALWGNSKDRADRELMVAALSRTDVSGFNCGPLAMMAITAGGEGLDVLGPAMKLLDCPAGTMTIDHGFHIFGWERQVAFEFVLFTMPDELFLDALIARLQTEDDPYRLSMLIHAIWSTVSPKGKAALAAYAARGDRPGDARRFAREMLGHKGDRTRVTETREQLQAQRRRIAVSPYFHGAFERFHAITDDMATLAR